MCPLPADARPTRAPSRQQQFFEFCGTSQGGFGGVKILDDDAPAVPNGKPIRALRAKSGKFRMDEIWAGVEQRFHRSPHLQAQSVCPRITARGRTAVHTGVCSDCVPS